MLLFQNYEKPVSKTRRGRIKKGKNKKTIKINGLDLLHDQTLLSTSPQGTKKYILYAVLD